MEMKPYQNLRGDSGIVAYRFGGDWIRIQFRHGGVFEYTSAGVGKSHLRTMKRLAEEGGDLNTFINQTPGVRNGYSR